ncbi:MAG: hypothetical protein AB1555_18545 [Nitrospirota bacterium]
MIPIKTDQWDVTKPGYQEIDLVSHAGASAAGEFLQTLDCVDIQTTWVERQAVRGKSRHAVVQAMTTIEQQLPFLLRGVDSDNGSEFINHHLWAFCQDRPSGQQVQFTRSRPDKKGDNAHVEQKNWTHVRKLVGWERYDTEAAFTVLISLYADLRLFQNLFQPSMKLIRRCGWARGCSAAMTRHRRRSSGCGPARKRIRRRWPRWRRCGRRPIRLCFRSGLTATWSDSGGWPPEPRAPRAKRLRGRPSRGRARPGAGGSSAAASTPRSQ